MKKTKKIYLAGPEVFLPNAFSILESNKRLLEEKGFSAYSPFDGNVSPEEKRDLRLAKCIFEENCRLIRESDLVLANCNFFRGACVDDGTSFEIGYAFRSGKRIYGYGDSELALHLETERKIPTKAHESGYRIDEEGYLLNEDFGNRINLMLEFSILESGGRLVRGSFSDLVDRLAEWESV